MTEFLSDYAYFKRGYEAFKSFSKITPKIKKEMIKDLAITFLGILLGLTMYAIYLDYSDNTTKNGEIKENVSLKSIPKELPKDIEFDEIRIPKNLKEVIL